LVATIQIAGVAAATAVFAALVPNPHRTVQY
jgi:hypothetical protein